MTGCRGAWTPRQAAPGAVPGFAAEPRREWRGAGAARTYSVDIINPPKSAGTGTH